MSRVEQFALDLGDDGPRFVALDSRTGRPLDADGKPVKLKRRNGVAMRDEAIEQAIENEKAAWRELHDKELSTFLAERAGAAFIAEDFRRWFDQRGNASPHHHNVWGAMWMRAARQHLVIKTGKYRHMQDARSHARMTTEWAKDSAYDMPAL